MGNSRSCGLDRRTCVAAGTLGLLLAAAPLRPAAAQDFYAGKRLVVLVTYDADGPTTTRTHAGC